MNNEIIILYGFVKQLASMAEKAETSGDIARLKKTAAAFGEQAEMLIETADEADIADYEKETDADFIDTMWKLISKSKAVTADMEAVLAELDGELAAFLSDENP